MSVEKCNENSINCRDRFGPKPFDPDWVVIWLLELGQPSPGRKNFCPVEPIKSLWAGQKIPGSDPGLPLHYCGYEVWLGCVRDLIDKDISHHKCYKPHLGKFGSMIYIVHIFSILVLISNICQLNE